MAIKICTCPVCRAEIIRIKTPGLLFLTSRPIGWVEVTA